MTSTDQKAVANDHAEASLRELLRSRNAIAFVGAGASAGLYPLWQELLRRLIDAASDQSGAMDEGAKSALLQIASSRPQQAVRIIKDSLGEGMYVAELRRIFRPQARPDGVFFTEVQEALLKLPFKGYVTTCYDPGLLEARMTLRPDARSTGFATWKDLDDLHAWYTGEIFGQDTCPILFAHGIYNRSDSIVLGTAEYREAYRPGAFRRVFERLWGQERLVFVGFSFSDAWLDFLAEEILTEVGTRKRGSCRHVAILGTREPCDDTIRKLFADQYNALVCTYQIGINADGTEDHRDLLRLLTTCAESVPPKSVPWTRAALAALQSAVGATNRAPRAHPPPSHKWYHEPTNDDRYVEPLRALERLNRWMDDGDVRMIAVVGLGGLGKTSLIGHYLKQAGGDRRRPVQALFAWSFYVDPDVDNFVMSLLSTLSESPKPKLVSQRQSARDVERLLKEIPVLLFLDGLEVLQERPGTMQYGVVLNETLREVLQIACHTAHSSIVIMTSRFPFPDLSGYLGAGLRVLELDHLTPDEGATLLAQCGVRGTAEQRAQISRRIEGHPLGLRIFAATLANEHAGDPTRLLHRVFEQSGLNDGDPLERKLRHLLTFYESRLPPVRAALLSVISLFRTPVDSETITSLARGLPQIRAIADQVGTPNLELELDLLCREHMVFRDQVADQLGYSCHPVLKDYFRGVLVRTDRAIVGDLAEKFLSDAPATASVASVEAIQPILASIELLIAAGNYTRAHELYTVRLRRGEVFATIPAAHEGLQCALEFVGTAERKRQCQQELPGGATAFYLNEVALCAMVAGEFERAIAYFREAEERDRAEGNTDGLLVGAKNMANLLLCLGRASDAEKVANAALSSAKSYKTHELQVESILMAIAASQGRVKGAIEIFQRLSEHTDLYSDAAATRNLREKTNWETALCGLPFFRMASLCYRLARMNDAKAIAEFNKKRCREVGWKEDVSRCDGLIGRIQTSFGARDDARSILISAERAMREGSQLRDLPSVLIGRAECEVEDGRLDDGLFFVDEALRLAAPRKMVFEHGEALALRGTIKFRTGAAFDKAEDDADASLTLARQCEDPWTELKALDLLSKCAKKRRDTAHSQEYAREASLLQQRIMAGVGEQAMPSLRET